MVATRIRRLVLKNYRQFKDIDISFNKKTENDLHVIIGVMGTGKTNILNAINWCLYGDEPHLSKVSQQLPLLNLKSIEEARDGEDREVRVEVWVETENNRYMVFTRKAIFRVYKNKQPVCQATEFEVRIPDEKGNIKILVNEEADAYVERFVPKRIREFFFFDGERLDRYFREATGQNIRHAVFMISQIDLLDRIYDKIDKILRDIRREVGKVSPRIEEIRKELEKKEDELKEVENKIEECKKQIAIAKGTIEKYEEKLRNLPDVESLEKEREKLSRKRRDKKERLNEKLKEKQSLLFEYGKIIMIWPAIKKVIQIIEEKRKNKEIPPTFDKGLLEDVIKNGICSICGRPLDDNAEERVKKLLKEIKLSSEIARQLMYMDAYLDQFKEKIKHFEKEIKRKTEEIKEYEKDLSEIEQRLSEIDRELSGYNVEKIKEWHEERKKYEEIYKMNIQRLGILNAEKGKLIKDIEKLKKQLDDELKKERKVEKLKKQIDFCTKALNVVEKTKEAIMTETRKRIEAKTEELFLNLIWKKETFKSVKIDKDYNVNLIHKMGYECLGTISGGEREVLTLAFTMALHEISGFNSPIIVDRPLAMVSGEPRKNIVDVLSQISMDKQVILFFTPDDYSADISKILDPKASNRFRFYMTADEKETKVVVL